MPASLNWDSVNGVVWYVWGDFCYWLIGLLVVTLVPAALISGCAAGAGAAARRGRTRRRDRLFAAAMLVSFVVLPTTSTTLFRTFHCGRLDDGVEFGIGVGEAGEVLLLDDGGGEARLGEDHHAGGRLHEMGAGARADDQEERVLDLAVHPNDAGQAAEDLSLAALAQDGAHLAAAPRDREQRAVQRDAHALPACRRAARSFRTNCVALMT